jgi:LysR family transcriptional activator of glutamate synthase operon
MRLEQLRYIVAIADTGSFTLASERLFIAQPSISQAVTSLEKELKLTLFTRYRTGAVPTAEGLQVIAHARKVLQEVSKIEKFSHTDHNDIKMNVTVGVIPSLCTVLLPEVIASYKKKFPNVTVSIRENGTEKILQDCVKGNIDIGLISLHDKNEPGDPRVFKYHYLFDGHLAAYVGKLSSLSSRTKITFRELLPYPLFLFGDEFSLHAYCLEQISRYGKPNIVSTMRNPESIKRFVMQIDAVGFGPDISLAGDARVKNHELFPLEITDASAVHFGLVTNRKREINVAAEALIKEIISKSKKWLNR